MSDRAALLHSLNPATGEIVGSVPVATAQEVAATVARARRAQPAWAALTPAARADLLRGAGERLIERADALGLLLTREMGKPLREGVGEVRGCGAGLGAVLDEIVEALAPEERADERTLSIVYHDPLGVCAAITPWNFPLAMPHWLVVPALVAGNTVVLKPSEETPLIAQAYVDVLREFLPVDVLQGVHGADDVGRWLVESPVDLVAFTGSRETGKKIMASAAGGLKRLILELGGKDALVVLADADLDAAAEFATLNSFRNAGQVCVSTERIYVDARVAGAFERKVAERAAALRVGNGQEPDVQMGPMINARQKAHVERQVKEALAAGARLVAGSLEQPGNFLAPLVLSDLRDDLSLLRDETFGPVACLCPFESVDEAVRRTNDSPFGLGAAVFGAPETARAVARRLDAGMIGINKGCGGASGTPWVGAKESGFGFHSSRDGHRQFTQTRVISQPR